MNFILNAFVIENVTSYKYLGVYFHKNVKVTYCVKQIVQLAKRASFALDKKTLLLNVSIERQIILIKQLNICICNCGGLKKYT